jgi:16S rRNA (uracil1498-N3)-methyltransferase
MHRFFIPPHSIKDNRVLIRGTAVHQIRDVLRMKPGDEIILLDNSGWAYNAVLVTVDRETVRARVIGQWELKTEPQTRTTLYQGMLKGSKFEWVLQKGTEVGVTAFVPVLAARCIIGTINDVSNARVERWERIIIEAAEQSGRAILPNISNAMLFAHACDQAGRNGLALIPWEGERSNGLREALQIVPKPREISVFIGPEGGFTEEEIVTAKEHNVIPVSLGPRILRADTAGLAAVAAILYELGDFG